MLLSVDAVSGSAEARAGGHVGGSGSVVVMGNLKRSPFAVQCPVVMCYRAPPEQPRGNKAARESSDSQGRVGRTYFG